MSKKINKIIDERIPDIIKHLERKIEDDTELYNKINESQKNIEQKSTLISATKLFKKQEKQKKFKQIEIKPNFAQLTLILSAFTKDYNQGSEVKYFLPVNYDLVNENNEIVAPVLLNKKITIEFTDLLNVVNIENGDEKFCYDFEKKAIISLL